MLIQVLQALKQDPETVAKFIRDGRSMQAQNQTRGNPLGNPQGNNMQGNPQMHQLNQGAYRGTVIYSDNQY